MALEKIERRGKWGGVKAHLSGPECQRLLDWREKYKKQKNNGEYPSADLSDTSFEFVKDLSKSIKGLLEEDPKLLEDRTEDQVKESLLKDKRKIEEQLQTMESGADWKKVK